MAISFDGTNKRIVLDSSSTTAATIWTDWVDWLASDTEHNKWLPALRQVGGDDLGGGLSIPPYIFLLNGWRVRPMESNHNLTITGNLFVDGGGVPVVSTLGTYQVNVNYTVPVQAQGISTSGSTGASASEITDAVWAAASAILLLDRTEFMEKVVKNKRVITADKTLVVYDNDGTTPILTKALKDKDGAAISDLASGVLAQEEASSV